VTYSWRDCALDLSLAVLALVGIAAMLGSFA
jgi:hypothetical protein